MKFIQKYSFMALFLCLPSQLHMAECKIDAHYKQITLENIAECFNSVTIPGALHSDSAEALIINNQTPDNQTDRNGTPFNKLTITNLDTGEKLLKFAGYIKPVYVARREAVCWYLDHNDGTITLLPLEPITINGVGALNNEQRNLIQTIVQRDTPDAFIMSEEQAKLFSTLPAWFQRVLHIHYGVKSSSVVHYLQK